jgi:hypothetical protein
MDADDCERFLNELEEYLEAYKQHLSSTLSRQTVTKHSIIIHHWCQFICQYKSLTDFSGLTIAMVRAGFFSYFKSYNDDDLTSITTANIIKRFLVFVKDEYGIGNPTLMLKLVK